MNLIPSSVKWQYALVHLEDDVAFSKTSAKHIEHVWYIVSLLQDAGVNVKLKKCEFLQVSWTIEDMLLGRDNLK